MKRGGSKMGYTAQFNLLSPCYKEGEQPASDFRIGGAKATKKGKSTTKKATKAKKPSTTKKVKKGKSSKQRGGSSCGASPSVSEMGVIDTPPASLPKSHSQDAFLERYSNNIMKGGENVKPNNNKTKALNEIKNKLIPSETISGFALIVKKISKNNKNRRNDKYSIEIVSKEENGTTQIEKLDKTKFDFRDISDNVYNICKKVFPVSEKTQNGITQANAQTQPNAQTQTQANAQTQPNAQTQTQTQANAKAKANTNAKAKAKANANAEINSLF